MRAFHHLLTFLLVSVIVSGCGKTALDNETAKKLIIAEAKFPKVVDHTISAGDPLVAKRLLSLGLESDGVVTIMRTQTYKDSDKPWVTFTNKAKPYLLPTPEKDTKYQRQNVKIADIEFGEIKGIVMSNDNKASMVKYTTYYKNVTPFSKLFKTDYTKPKESKAYFVLYDSGWKMDKHGEMMFIGIE